MGAYRYIVNSGGYKFDVEDYSPEEPSLLSSAFLCPVCGVLWARIYGQNYWAVHARKCLGCGGGEILSGSDFELPDLFYLPRELLIYVIATFKVSEVPAPYRLDEAVGVFTQYGEGAVPDGGSFSGRAYLASD